MLWHIELAAAKQRLADGNIGTGQEDEVARNLAELASALAMILADLDHLIAAWIDRFVEQLGIMRRNHERLTGALAAGEQMPKIDMGNFIAVSQLQNVLQAVGDRIDPHIGPIIEALGNLDPDADHHLMAVLEFAGPAVAGAVAKLLATLRERGISRWPSHLARALANASRFDDRVIPALINLLAIGEHKARPAAIEVLGTIGPAARPAAGQLLALGNGDESERCGMIWALSQQGAPTPEFLAVLDAAMHDENGYVRRAAARALGVLTPEPARFVPWLIEACDWTDDLHDESLPEAAVASLGRYGPRCARRPAAPSSIRHGSDQGQNGRPRACSGGDPVHLDRLGSRPKCTHSAKATRAARRRRIALCRATPWQTVLHRPTRANRSRDAIFVRRTLQRRQGCRAQRCGAGDCH